MFTSQIIRQYDTLFNFYIAGTVTTYFQIGELINAQNIILCKYVYTGGTQYRNFCILKLSVSSTQFGT